MIRGVRVPCPRGEATRWRLPISDKRHSGPIDAKQLDSLRVFHEVARALTSNLELESILREILSKMEEFFGPDGWALLIREQETQDFVCALAARGSRPEQRNVRVPGRGNSLAALVARSGEPLVVGDVQADPMWSRWAAAHPHLKLQSIAWIPIRHGDRVLGVLQLHNMKLDLLPDNSLAFLRVLCDYAGIALHNAQQVELIHKLSITDDTTGLYNGRHMYDLLAQEIEVVAQARQEGRDAAFSLLFLDLDHFKSVNDTHGHLVGSRLLAEVGGLIKRTLGPQHAGFRYGGDEFVALLRGLNEEAATELALTLREALRSNAFLAGEGLGLTIQASLGLATFPAHGGTLHTIIRAADTMMYVAKARGRDQLAVADAEVLREQAPVKTSRHEALVAAE